MICQKCGIEASTKYVAFYRNIGALIIRFPQTIEGNLCKSCIHGTFWKFTLINCTLGWWGAISLLVTPIFILNNVFRYVFALGMEPVPFDAVEPELTDHDIERLGPHTDDLISQLNAGNDLEIIAEDIAMKAGVTEGQVVLYVQALIAASKDADE
jgi:hypothetical protein